MPLDLAFGRRRLASARSSRFALTPDGTKIAYVVETPPTASNGGDRFTPSGVPSPVVGGRVHVADVDKRTTVAVGPDDATSWRPAWSPDGTQLAFYCDEDRYPQLWIHDLATGRSRPVSKLKIKAKLFIGDEPYWSPDGTEIYVPVDPQADAANSVVASTESDRTIAVHVYRTGPGQDVGEVLRIDDHYLKENQASIRAIDPAGGDDRTLVPANTTPPPSVVQVSPTGRWVSYLSVFYAEEAGATPPSENFERNFHSLAVVPATGGDVTTVAEHLTPGADRYLDSYLWHPTRDQLFWVKAGQLWTAELDRSVGSPRRIAADLGEVTLTPLVVTRDESAIVVGVDPVEAPDVRHPQLTQLAVVPLDRGTPTRITLPDGLLFQHVVRQNHATAWEPQTGTLTIVAREESTAETVLLRFDRATGRSNVLWRGLGKVRFAGAPTDHGFVVGCFEDFHEPSELYVFDHNCRRKQPLTTIEPRLEHISFGPAESFETTVPRYDGTLSSATTAVLLPAGTTKGDRLPAVMFFYPASDPSSQRTAEAASYGGGTPSTLPAAVFITRGYAVLLAEAPISPQGGIGNPLDELVDVLVPQVHRAAELGYIDLNRVAIAGQSGGGYGTAAVISATNLFRAAIAIAGMYDLPGSYSWLDLDTGKDSFDMIESFFRMGTHPWSAQQRYLTNSPYYRADRIHTPLLMLHGTEDTACPVAEAGKLFNALKRLGRTAQLAVYEGEGHVPTAWSRTNAVDATQRALEFLDHHLRPPA